MFVLSEISDTIPIAPNTFAYDSAIAVQDSINKKYANKLIPGVGLALAFYDILTCGEGKIKWGDGLVWHKTNFRLTVFAPIEGEVIVGTVHSSTTDHIRVSLGFFSDIYIPKHALPPNTFFDHEDDAFFMLPDMEEVDVGEPDEAKKDPFNSDKATQRLYMYRGEAIRFRVTNLEWQEIEPEAPNIRDKPRELDPETGMPKELTREEIQQKETQREKEAGLRIIASIEEQGMGHPEWWLNT
ncbi:hypothetical protein NliqN6_2618 [Naganishia liquefaciens]|uniref:DNA-directed RNA polymerase n=1 Tax=Naganishia liquefaciens TaxID=104408 RepID=A0A8H3YFY8_9TREE|nr:hypothetical protein NliqN6_2618 [Naganishia liquefaciens]